jgi:phage terminase small subunit
VTKNLTNKQRQFINEYFVCGMNASEAARRSGYSHPNVQGSRLLANVSVSAEINARLEHAKMSADEVLARLTDFARADFSDFLDIQRGYTTLDLSKAQDAGKLHLIKKYKVTKTGTEIELHDPVRALELLGKHHRLLTDKVEVDWRFKLEQSGIDASDLFEQLVRARAEAIRNGTG